ncbi:hypothetical protein SISSUDRAFT_459239 [Sistotremastrum suecicum HHB10207 ss-3]|uniref:Uncharacterized protein n=1 Tax=Sistotremastrum suecicum HHB10207 ss-3 TaxID=1314776 RepID=A0A165Y6H5_9AGAM|nr:hypothetical protein SISSUDRAFT_459239 [Sistotremastrum suecicum HHB10207 ss-3]
MLARTCRYQRRQYHCHWYCGRSDSRQSFQDSLKNCASRRPAETGTGAPAHLQILCCATMIPALSLLLLHVPSAGISPTHQHAHLQQ